MAEITLRGFRRVELEWGESLQALAARELGDAARWVEIAAINRLAPPYVTGDPGQSGPRVALYGDTLIVPAAAQDIAPGEVAPEKVFGADVALMNRGRLEAADGDFMLALGRANLQQALEHRLATDQGELLFHQDYGCRIGRLRGRRNDAANLLLARVMVGEAVVADDRVARIVQTTAEAVGAAIHVDATAETVTGHPVDFQYEG